MQTIPIARKIGEGCTGRFLLVALACLLIAPVSWAARPCRVIHGRARLYTADGNLRIWHIGTHHEFEPADPASWKKLEKLLLPHGIGHSQYDLYADFTLCPTQPLRNGWVQPAIVKSFRNARLVPAYSEDTPAKPPHPEADHHASGGAQETLRPSAAPPQ